MHLNNQTWMTILFGGAVIGFLYLLYHLIVAPRLTRKREKEKEIEALRAEIAAEETRIAALPKLDKTYLMEVPHAFRVVRSLNCPPKLARSYAIHGNQIVAYDENLTMWVGLVMRETLDSLKDGEYVAYPHWAPFRGDHQQEAGPAVHYAGRDFSVYPSWMSSLPRTIEEYRAWAAWAQMERIFTISVGSDYEAEAKRILPPEVNEAIREKRGKLASLRQKLARLTSPVR